MTEVALGVMIKSIECTGWRGKVQLMIDAAASYFSKLIIMF